MEENIEGVARTTVGRILEFMRSRVNILLKFTECRYPNFMNTF